MSVHELRSGKGTVDTPESYAGLVAEHTRDMIIVTGPDGLVRWVNPAFEHTTGYRLDEVVGRKPGDVLQGPETDPETVREVARQLSERSRARVEILNYTKDQRPYWIEMDVIPVFDQSGQHTHFIAVERDITEGKELYLAMQRARETDARRRRERKVLSEMSEWLYAANSLEELSRIVEASMHELLQEAEGTLYVYRNSRDRLEPLASWGGAVSHPNLPPSDCWAMRRGRSHMYGRQLINVPCPHDGSGGAHPSICVPLLAQGETLGMLNVAFPDAPVGKQTGSSDEGDLDERRQLVLMASEQIGLAIANVRLRDELRTQSVRDVLTGLANRRAFLTALREALGAAAHNGSSMALLSVDVDHFKSINDTYGHGTGDEVLRVLSSIMGSVTAGRGTPYRVGGEEFVVLLPDTDLSQANEIAEDLRAAVERNSWQQSGSTLPEVTISAGVAAYPDHADCEQALIEMSDIALYRAKNEGRNRVAIA